MTIRTNAPNVIRGSLELCQLDGIQIERGPCFCWAGKSGAGEPLAVNWAGSVLWIHRGSSLAYIDTSYSQLVELLDVDLFWYYKFSMGFDRGRPISIVDKETEREIRKDEVGLEGLRIAREFILPRKILT